MKNDLGETLKNEKIRALSFGEPIRVQPETSIEVVIDRMFEAKIGCAVVEEKGKLVGIFTERDILTRVVEAGVSLKSPVESFMTPRPKCLDPEDSVAEAIRVMNRGGYRHLPLVDRKGKTVGVLSVKRIVSYLAEHFPAEVYNLPPDPRQIQRSREGA